ncbi:MAG: 1-acyl-sn-glycerol-3-phosphate acyltransferase [Bacteroides sp.]
MTVEECLREGCVDIRELITAKNPKLARRLPNFLYRYLERILHLSEVNATIRAGRGLPGQDFARHILEEFGVTYDVRGLETLPTDGRYLFASNHPLGGLDGVVLIDAIGRALGQVYFPVNDLLLVLPQFRDIFLPVNKHGNLSQSAAERLNAAYASDAQILYFPAGLCSRRSRRGIRDLEWKPNFVGKALEYNRTIVPIHFGGRNSNFFYNLAWLRKHLGIGANIEMLYLVDEMYRQRGAHLELRFGKPIPPTELAHLGSTRKEIAATLQRMVYTLGGKT